VADILLTEIDTADRPAWLPAILDIWEASVRASHDFLKDEDIVSFRMLVAQAAASVSTLLVAHAEGPVGFMGLEARKIEMLFLHPSCFRRGIGTQMVQYALGRYGVDAVDCNEQNPGALAFYERMGFRVVSRSATDGSGHPFPLLSLLLPHQENGDAVCES